MLLKNLCLDSKKCIILLNFKLTVLHNVRNLGFLPTVCAMK